MSSLSCRMRLVWMTISVAAGAGLTAGGGGCGSSQIAGSERLETVGAPTSLAQVLEALVPASERHTITPCLVVADVTRAVEFYRQVYGAEPQASSRGPDGMTAAQAVRIEDAVVVLVRADGNELRAPEQVGGSPVALHIYVADVDRAWAAAAKAGATLKVPLADMFWGDRFVEYVDPFGHRVSVATHIEDLAAETVSERAAAWTAAMAAGQPAPDFSATRGVKASSVRAPGFHAVEVQLVVDGGVRALATYAASLGAGEISRIAPGDRLFHAEMTIGDSRLLVSDAMPEMGSERSPTQLGGSPVVLAIHLERAPAADWPGTTTPAKDPFGHLWLAD